MQLLATKALPINDGDLQGQNVGNMSKMLYQHCAKLHTTPQDLWTASMNLGLFCIEVDRLQWLCQECCGH